MSYDIVIGRDATDKEKFGNRGLIYLGKGYVKMGTYTSLSNKLWMDIARSHVVLIAGKRGSGKSYSAGVIAEELANLLSDNAKNIASLIFDTMGIFWTMKYRNEKDKALLSSWELETKLLPVKVFVPFGKIDEYQKKMIPFDKTFALKVSELQAEDWITLFNLEFTSLPGVLIERTITALQEKGSYTIKDIENSIINDSKASDLAKEIVYGLFSAASTWGIFSNTREGTEVSELLTGGTTTVLDISIYSSSSAFNIRVLELYMDMSRTVVVPPVRSSLTSVPSLVFENIPQLDAALKRPYTISFAQSD